MSRPDQGAHKRSPGSRWREYPRGRVASDLEDLTPGKRDAVRAAQAEGAPRRHAPGRRRLTMREAVVRIAERRNGAESLSRRAAARRARRKATRAARRVNRR